VFAPDLDPLARMRRAEASSAIYIHSHMDEDTFETDRIRRAASASRARRHEHPVVRFQRSYRNRDARLLRSPRRR
jgi:hypothetical protein